MATLRQAQCKLAWQRRSATVFLFRINNMKINILTIFPEMFTSILDTSIIKRAQKKKLLEVNLFNLRDWSRDKHKSVDDKPYGGGAGMLMKVDVIDRALCDLKFKIQNSKSKIILLTPQGKTFNQKMAKKLSKYQNLILICGHYEGFDERIRKLADAEISIGNYVLTGGEIPAMVIMDAVSRLVPGVLGKNESSEIESFSMDKFIKDSSNTLPLKPNNLHLLREYPQYTRPESYKPTSKEFKKFLKVPKILLSGDHQKIKSWRAQQVMKKSTLES